MATPVTEPSTARALVRVMAGLGIAVGALLFVLKAPGPFTLSTHLFVLWLVLPWLVALALTLTLRGHVRGLLTAAALMAGFELFAFYATFLAPRGSTSALVYAVKPVWQLGLMGLSLLAAVIFDHLRHRAPQKGDP